MKYRWRAKVLGLGIRVLGYERACRWGKSIGWVMSWDEDKVYLAW
jgi:hypothetical protein